MTDPQHDAYPPFGEGEAESRPDVWPFRQPGAWPAEDSVTAFPGVQEPQEEDIRRKAAGIIADALIQAEEMVSAPARETGRQMVDETVGGLRTLGEHLERCVESLTAERSEIELEIRSLRELVSDLSGMVQSMREGAPMGVPAPAREPDMPWISPTESHFEPAVEPEMPSFPEPVYEEAPPPPPPPPPTFATSSPVSIQVHNVSNFNLLVRLERILSNHPAVQSAGIESYQEEQARFVLSLREPATGEEIQEAIMNDLGHGVNIEKIDPEWNELILRLEPESPAPRASEPWMAGLAEQHTNGSWQ